MTDTSHSPNSPMDLAYRLLKNYNIKWNKDDEECPDCGIAGESPYDDSESPYAQARNPTSDEDRLASALSGGAQRIDPDFDPKGDCCKVARERILNEAWGSPYEWGNGFEDNDGAGNPHYKGSAYPLDHYNCEELRNYITREVKELLEEAEALETEHGFGKDNGPRQMGENFAQILDDWRKCEEQQTVSTDDESWQDTIEAGEPIDIAYRLLKARQTKLYNWIQDYPGKEPVQQMSAQPSAHMRNYLEGEYPEELWSFIGDNPDDTESHGASRHRSDDEGNYLAVGVRGKSPIGELPTRGPFSNIKDGGGVRVVGKDDMPDPDDIVVIPKNASHHGNFNPKQKGQFRKPKSKQPKRFARVLDIGR